MEKMKYDMGGGAAVIGAMRALAQLKPSVRITALDSHCREHGQRPRAAAGRHRDVAVGKTVEVLNTDAEGRLILIDAITYAIRLGCTHLVDAATLTGAIVVALGTHPRRRLYERRGVPRHVSWRRASQAARRCGTCRSMMITRIT